MIFFSFNKERHARLCSKLKIYFIVYTIGVNVQYKTVIFWNESPGGSCQQCVVSFVFEIRRVAMVIFQYYDSSNTILILRGDEMALLKNLLNAMSCILLDVARVGGHYHFRMSTANSVNNNYSRALNHSPNCNYSRSKTPSRTPSLELTRGVYNPRFSCVHFIIS